MDYPVVHTTFSCSGHCSANGEDIRVVNNTGNEIAFGLKKTGIDDFSLSFRVNMVDSSVDYSVYYGNSSVVGFGNTSWNEARYNFYDTFPGTTLDSNLWETYTDDSGFVSVDNWVKLSIGAGSESGAGIYTKQNFTKADGVLIKYRDLIQNESTRCTDKGRHYECGADGLWIRRHEPVGRDTKYYGFVKTNSTNFMVSSIPYWEWGCFYNFAACTYDDFSLETTGDYYCINGTNVTLVVGKWYDIEVRVNSTGYVWAYLNDSLQYHGQANSTNWGYISSIFKIEFYYSDAGSPTANWFKGIDDVRYRKYTTPEPTTSLGSEETSTTTTTSTSTTTTTIIPYEELVKKVQDLENRMNLVERIIRRIQDVLKKITGYLTYLPKGQRKHMVCGYMIDNNITEYSDLGLTCELIEKRKKVKCKCFPPVEED